MFQTTADTNYEGNVIASLAPGIYDNATFLGATLETGLKKGDGTAIADRLTFKFKTEDGQPLEHSELKPADSDGPDKVANKTKRIGHILSKFYPKEQLAQSNTTWDAYATWVMQMAAAANKAQKVKFMVVGNVYDGKARTQLPNYPPFIKKAGEELAFSQNHLKDNAEYEAFNSVKPDAASTAAPSATTVGEF